MDYERAYKEALERAKGIHSFSSDIAEIKRMEQIFPELKESEDERIRKSIICGMNALKDQKKETFAAVPIDDCITWLEKQGEQKPVDTLEPKFKVGDWIINRTDATIMQIVNNIDFYESVEIGGQRRTDTYNYVEWDFRLWTIQDAKDGDVLSNGEMTVIFKHFEEPSYRQHIIAYIGLDNCGHIQVTDEHWTLGIDKTQPATKEQRELLFQKMTEAGYEWNAEKKELRKLEIFPNLSNSNKTGKKWTEEDEKCIDNCCLLIGAADDCYEKTFKDDCIHYLQSIKERIALKPMPIKQKDIDDLVFDFKWSSENFKNKRVTDIYRQGIYDVMELLKQRMEE